MKTCEDHQLALEMRRHGALEAAEMPELEAHLASCAECQKFEAQAEAVTELLRSSPPPKQVDPSVIQAKAARHDRLLSYLPHAALASFVGQGAIISWLMPSDARLKVWGVFWIAGFLAAAGCVWAARVYRHRSRVALSQGVEAWIAAQRQSLKKDRALWKYLRFLGPAMSLGTGIGAWRVSMAGEPLAPMLWGTAGLLALGSVVILRMGVAVDRELRFFGEEVQP